MISIYKIIDNTNGNIYVGSTCNYTARKYKHKHNLSKCSSQIIIDNGDYRFDIIEKCHESIRREREQYFLDNLKCINKNQVIRNKEKYKIFKKEYDKIRLHWRYSFGETCKDTHNILYINPDLFL
tara:strand:+ start:2951 stop:3325 length:375 start_codon:yes stop_codon:yes gene_type:complete